MARNAVAGKGLAIKSSADKPLSERTTQELISASSGLKRLIVQALERGIVTVDEISSTLPEKGISPDQLEELIALFENIGVTVGLDEKYSGAGGTLNVRESADDGEVTISISKARQDLADLCNRVAYGGERLVIARRGKARAALVPMEDLELLGALEDAVDLAAARQALRQAEKAGAKPLEEVLRDLGLDA